VAVAVVRTLIQVQVVQVVRAAAAAITVAQLARLTLTKAMQVVQVVLVRLLMAVAAAVAAAVLVVAEQAAAVVRAFQLQFQVRQLPIQVAAVGRRQVQVVQAAVVHQAAQEMERQI
jgi:hypothetical protein